MFTAEQIEHLSGPLDRTKVKSRSQAGQTLSYIEGWHAIAEANRIFGFDTWNRETLDTLKCGEPEMVGDKWRVRFMCRVRITVGTVIRDGTGYGSGIAKDMGDAYESAIKEAETDAMKRALMTFGNPFGLALYDKTQANVAMPADPDDDEITTTDATDLEKRIKDTGTDRAAFLTYFKVDSLKRLRVRDLRKALSMLARKAAENTKAADEAKQEAA